MLAELRAEGFKVSTDQGLLYVEPASALSEEQRERIRRHKISIIRELRAEAAEFRQAIATARDAAFLSDFKAALRTGRQHICSNCDRFQFGANPAETGHCERHGPVWPFVPIACPDFLLSPSPAAPAYVPFADRRNG